MQILLNTIILLGFFMFETGMNLDTNPSGILVEIPERIYYNGMIITMDEQQPQVEALAIKQNKIMAIGTDEEILGLQGQDQETQLIDLGGLTILPGFNEAHCHWLSWREHLCTAHEEDIVEYPPLEDIMQNLSANGWTSFSELAFGWPGDASIEHLNNSVALEASGNLPVRINGYWGNILDPTMLDSFENHPPDRFYSDKIRAQGIKLYVDGPFGTADILSQEETNALVERGHHDGWRIAAHAVNISGVEKILTAFEHVLGEESNDKYRHRIEHAVKVTDDQMNRMLAKGIIASFQIIGPPDWPAQETHMLYIANTQPELQMRWREFVNAGLRCVASSDAPFNNTTCDYNPFRVIHQGVTRIGYLDREHAQWELNQRLTIAQCLKLMTIDAAYATAEEEIKGSLTPGKYADLIVVSRNPLDLEDDPDGLLDIQVVQTLVGGEVVYCNDLVCSGVCVEKEIFEIDSAAVTVSNYLAESSPVKAFDQNQETQWSAGDGPPQWVQIDLFEDKVISKIELVTSQFPAGRTVHQILGAKNDQNCDLQLVFEFDQLTNDRDVLIYTPQNGVDTLRYVQILTTVSPSWVSWFEINIEFKDNTVSTYYSNHNILSEIYISPVPARDQVSISYHLSDAIDMEININSFEGRTVKTLFTGREFPGVYNHVFNLDHELGPGIYFIEFRSGVNRRVKKLIMQ